MIFYVTYRNQGGIRDSRTIILTKTIYLKERGIIVSGNSARRANPKQDIKRTKEMTTKALIEAIVLNVGNCLVKESDENSIE